MNGCKRMITTVVAAAVVLLPAVFTAGPAAAAPGLDKCSKSIDKESLKIQSTVLKVFQKCNDYYRKEVVTGEKKGLPPDLAKAGTACEKQLAKTVGAGGTIDKEIAKLAKLTALDSKGIPKTCRDADLIALGHLDTATFGSRWEQFQAAAALEYAYEQQLTGSRDWVNIMDALAGAGSCPTCAKFQQAPCQEFACKLSAAQASVTLSGLPAIQVPLDGSLVLKTCDMSQLISNASGVLFVMGSPGRVLRPAPVGSLATACTKSISAEGLIQCGAGAQRVDYTTCQDHNTSGVANETGATSSGACTGKVCQASATDAEDPTVTNGGICFDATATGGVAGDAFVNYLSQIGLAPPGDNCTDPSTFTSAGTPQNTALTTGTVVASVKNADDQLGVNITSSPATGAKFDCATLSAGSSAGIKLVGAFPAINTLKAFPTLPDLFDSVTGFELKCE
jgi:hypothetical protein